MIFLKAITKTHVLSIGMYIYVYNTPCIWCICMYKIESNKQICIDRSWSIHRQMIKQWDNQDQYWILDIIWYNWILLYIYISYYKLITIRKLDDSLYNYYMFYGWETVYTSSSVRKTLPVLFSRRRRKASSKSQGALLVASTKRCLWCTGESLG